jgi:glyoxylase-like metal-dependent hydrolase (beta-lactamase superfamily II)
LQRLGIVPHEIKYIFLTHVHDDHAGFLDELVKATGATVVMHAEGPERLSEGHNRFVGGSSGRLAKLFVEAMRLFGKGRHEFPAMDVREAKNVLVWDGKRQFFKEMNIGLEIVALPGHTGDSIGLLTDEGSLFCGDASMNGFPSMGRNIVWIESIDDYRRSWDAMIGSAAHTIYPSHGKPFPKRDLIKYRRRLDKIKLY